MLLKSTNERLYKRIVTLYTVCCVHGFFCSACSTVSNFYAHFSCVLLCVFGVCNFELGIDADVGFSASGDFHAGDGALEFKALFVDCGVISRKGK